VAWYVFSFLPPYKTSFIKIPIPCFVLRTNKLSLFLPHSASAGHDPSYGARHLKRNIFRYILNPMSKKVLAGEIRDGSEVKIDLNHNKDGLDFIITDQPPADVPSSDLTPVQVNALEHALSESEKP